MFDCVISQLTGDCDLFRIFDCAHPCSSAHFADPNALPWAESKLSTEHLNYTIQCIQLRTIYMHGFCTLSTATPLKGHSK
jgi:hypothetical protein